MAKAWAARQADELEQELRALGTPERAEGEKRYLKSDLDFCGVTAGEIRRAVKEQLVAAAAGTTARTEDGRAGGVDHDRVLALVDALWSKPVFDRRLAAVLLLEQRADLLAPADLDVIERLIRDSKTWALVDGLAGDVTGAVLVAHPEGEVLLDAWAADDDFWVRRSALLALLKPLKRGAAFERFGRYADQMLDEREFFIRKAIGWVLRDISKTRPDEVWAWIAPRAGRASGVTIRELVKYLGDDRRKLLMDAYRRGVPVEPGVR